MTDLFIYSTSGTGEKTPLTRSGEIDGWFNEFPDVSPDGALVAFTQRNSAGTDIYTIRLDGTDQTRITASGNKGAREPSWSPDGTRIAFSSLDRDESPPNLNIYVVDLQPPVGPFLPPVPNGQAFRDALVDSDFDNLPEPGLDTRLIITRTGNTMTLYPADFPDLVWKVTCSDPHPMTGRYQTCLVEPPERNSPMDRLLDDLLWPGGETFTADIQYHVVSFDGYDDALRLRSVAFETVIAGEDPLFAEILLADANQDGVAESLQFAGAVQPADPDFNFLPVDVTGDGNPDYLGWAIGPMQTQIFTPLSDSNGDGIPDSVLFDFDRDGRADSSSFPIFADVVSGPPPGETVLVFNFAHFGKGEASGINLGSEIVLFNLDPVEAAAVSVSMRQGDGNPLTIDLNGESSPGVKELEIPPAGFRSLSTSREGEIVAGSVQVSANRAVGGTILFGGTGGLAGVGVSHVQDGGFAALFLSDTSLGIRTGIALRNLEDEIVDIQLKLFDRQAVHLGSGQLELAANGQRAVFLDELEWVTAEETPLDFSDLAGVLEARAGGRIAATLLLVFPNELATLPVAPLTLERESLPATAPMKRRPAGVLTVENLPQKLYFAQFGNGRQGISIRSRIFLLNQSSREAQVLLLLRDDSGGDLRVVLNGQEAPGRKELVIPPGGIEVLETDGFGDIVTGTVTVCSDQPLAGTILFTGDAGAAGVGASPLMRRDFLAPMNSRLTEGINTGIAVMNLADQSLTLDLTLSDADGAVLARGQLELPVGGHQALFLDQVSWIAETDAFDSSDFVGVLHATADGRFTAAVIRTSPGTFATFPVVPGLN